MWCCEALLHIQKLKTKKLHKQRSLSVKVVVFWMSAASNESQQLLMCNTMFSIYCILSSTVTNNSWTEACIMHTVIFFMLCHDSIRDPSKDHNLIDFLLVSIALKRFLWVLLRWRVQQRIWSYSAAAQKTAAVSCLLWSKQQISKFKQFPL